MARPTRPNTKPKSSTRPESPAEALTREGIDRMAAEDYPGAIALFSKAVSRDWKHSRARLSLARALGLGGNLEASLEEIERLVQIAGRDPGVLIDAAETLARFGQFERALAVYEKAARSDKSSKALTGVAAMAERLSRLDHAGEFAERAIERDPCDHDARLLAARVWRRSGDLDQAETVLREAIGREDAGDEIRAKQWYELATVLDGQARYGDAASALTEAKRCLAARAAMRKEPAEEAEYTLRRLVQELSPERVERWIAASAGMPPARVAALVGFPRSGTTLLEQVLDAHPLIESVEETGHLSAELVTGMHRTVAGTESVAQTLDRVERDVVVRCREKYLAAMAGHIDGPIGDRYILDKNPIRTLVMPVLRRAVPDAKIIVALRDPRDVVLSNLMQAFDPTTMNLAFLDVEKAGAFYALHIEGWLRLRELIDGWVEVRYEDVVVDPPAQARRVLDLLGLEWSDEVSRFAEHTAAKAVQSPTYAAVREQVHSRAVRRWTHYEAYLEPAMPTLERVAERLGYS